MVAEIKLIVEKLEHIQLDLDFIKEHIKDIDLVLTDDDLLSIREAEEEYKTGKTKRL